MRDAVKSKKNNTVGVILAGGRSQRMGGGHKCLLSLGNSTLLEHVIKRALPQVDRLILNINEDTNLFDAVNLPLVKDSINGFAGPLAGVLAGMEWSLEILLSQSGLSHLLQTRHFFRWTW